MIMILFGALPAGTRTYLFCRSDRHAFTSAFCNTLPVGCLKFCLSLEIRSSIWPYTISFQDDRTERATFSHLVHCNAYLSTASHKSDKIFIPVNFAWLSVFRALFNQISEFGMIERSPVITWPYC